MPTQHWKGPTIPTMGDDLLEAWPKALDTAGIVQKAESPTAAKVIVATAPEGLITPNTPAYFDINGIFWRSDGTTTNGEYQLKPVNPNEISKVVNAWSGDKTLTAGQSITLAVANLPVAPYDRQIDAKGMSYGSNVTGVVFLSITIQGGDRASARFPTGDNSSPNVFNGATIPAGASPDVRLALYGGSPSGGKVTLLSDTSLNRFIVTASPTAA